MKVDKGVCTSNDAYFAANAEAAAVNELNSIIKFETVFTTLVENKILAIKRDCELHENKKKSRTLKGFLSRKSDLTSVVDGSQEQQPEQTTTKSAVESKQKCRKNFFLRHKNKQSEVDVEKGVKRENATALDLPAENNVTLELAKVEVQSDRPGNDLGLAASDNLDSQSNEPQVDEALSFNPLPVINNNGDGPTNCDTLVVNSQTENAQLTVKSTNNSSSNVHSCRTFNEPTSSPPQPPVKNNNIEGDDDSLATTIDISLQQQSSIVKVSPIEKRIQVVQVDKSDVAICDDGTSSQNTSDIEFSLVSESLCELPLGAVKKTSTISDPVIKKPPLFLSPPLVRQVKVSERKAISCQSTPLFGRSQKGLTKEGDVKKVLTFQEHPKKGNEPKVAVIEKVKSQTIVTAPTSATTATTTTLAKSIPSTSSGPLESVHTSRKSQKHSKYRDVSVEYEITYDDSEGNQTPRGFISTFNSLTSQSTPSAVITTKRHSLKQAKSRCQHETGDDRTTNHDIELELDDLAVDVVNKKKRRRRKQHFE